MIDRIEKTVELNAPVERVWRALTVFRRRTGTPPLTLDNMLKSNMNEPRWWGPDRRLSGTQLSS
jgi:hypothetical protein